MSRRVKSTGPTPCSILIMADRPGKVEGQRGTCFCGPLGQELDRYLFACAGISRDSVHCMYLVDTYSDDPPTQDEIHEHWARVKAETDSVNPDYVGLMGIHAVRAGLSVPDIDMDWAHGLMFLSESRSCQIMPLTHVAAGLHQPRYAAQIAHDFTQFGRMIRGDDMPTGHWADACPDPIYSECLSIVPDRDVAVDTEGSPSAPWCVSASVRPGEGCVTKHGRVQIQAQRVIGHNMIHDLQVLGAMGIKVNKFTDTMVMASLLGTEPLGLKPLARRHCGMRQADYADIIAPARRDIALTYLSRVLDVI